MTTKKPEEATYFMAANSSRILEKIQIHFEINFVSSLNDSIQHFEFVCFLSCSLGQKIKCS